MKTIHSGFTETLLIIFKHIFFSALSINNNVPFTSNVLRQKQKDGKNPNPSAWLETIMNNGEIVFICKMGIFSPLIVISI